MESGIIYSERFAAKGFIAILGSVSIVILVLMLFHVMMESLEPFLPWALFYVMMFFLFFILTLGFSAFSITLTDETITVGFGIKKSRISLDNVSGIQMDEHSAIRYGGFGIRVARVEGDVTLVYNTLGTPRCVLSLKEGKFSRIVFSTKKPEEVILEVSTQLESKQ